MSIANGKKNRCSNHKDIKIKIRLAVTREPLHVNNITSFGLKDQISLKCLSSQISNDVKNNQSFICQIPIQRLYSMSKICSKWHVQYTTIDNEL